MTKAITEYAINAQLSVAAYADLRNILNTTDLIDRFKTAGISETQTRAFIGVDENNNPVSGTGFELIHHQHNTGSGFSATVFKDRATGEYHFAIRGTEIFDIGDLLNDANAVLSGGADVQIIDMLNYYLRLITPTDEDAVQVFRIVDQEESMGSESIDY